MITTYRISLIFNTFLHMSELPIVVKVYVKSRGTDCNIGDNFYISQ